MRHQLSFFTGPERVTKFVTKSQKVVTKCKNGEMGGPKTLRNSVVGVTGFEPATSTSQKMVRSRGSRIEERRRSKRSSLLPCRFPSPKGMVKLVEQG